MLLKFVYKTHTMLGLEFTLDICGFKKNIQVTNKEAATRSRFGKYL